MNRTTRVMVAVAAVLLPTVAATTASAAPPDVKGRFELPPQAAADGMVVMRAEPDLDALDAMRPGDSIMEPVIGMGRVNGRGEFQLKVDQEAKRLLRGRERVNVTVEYTGDTEATVDNLHLETLELDQEGAPKPMEIKDKIPSRLATGRDKTSDLVDINGLDEAPEPEEIAEPLQCHLTYIREIPNVQATAIVLGSNTAYVRFSASVRSGAVSKLGVGIKAGSSWGEASGLWSRTVSSSAESFWAYSRFSDATARYSLRLAVDYGYYKRTCPGKTTYETRPLARPFVGSFSPVKISASPTYRECRSLGSQITVTSGNATRWGGGVKLAAKGYGINVDSDTEFSSEVRQTFNPTRSGRWWCGRSGVPTGSNPGSIMGDFTNR